MRRLSVDNSAATSARHDGHHIGSVPQIEVVIGKVWNTRQEKPPHVARKLSGKSNLRKIVLSAVSPKELEHEKLKPWSRCVNRSRVTLNASNAT